MKFINKEIGLKLELDESLLLKLYQAGMKYYPKEFGGILIGQYSIDQKTLYIADTILPEKFISSRTSFIREVNELKRKLSDFYSQEPSLIYVGEWHTHPNGMPNPSITDLKAMREITNHTEVNITNPTLLIISNNLTYFDYNFYVQKNEKLYKYEREG